MLRVSIDEHNSECIVAGIVAALEKAKTDLAPGEIFFNVQDITTDAGGSVQHIGEQRSLGAYNKNTDKDQFTSNVDSRMWLLKFTHKGQGVVGMLNWYAIHPTSIVSASQLCCCARSSWKTGALTCHFSCLGDLNYYYL